MSPKLSYLDTDGHTRLKAWALPVVVAAIVLPISAAFLLAGASVGLAVTALVATAIVVIAARSRPYRPMEVADAPQGEARVLVLSAEELDGDAVQRVAELARGASDVRVLVTTPSSRIDRLFSDEDRARAHAQDVLARSAGSLTAAGLPVSGAVGDPDPAQAVEDELRSYPATEVVVVPAPGWDDEIEQLRTRLALPLTRLPG